MSNQYEFLYECDELGLSLKCLFEHEPEEIGSVEPMSGMKLEPIRRCGLWFLCSCPTVLLT